MPKKKDYKSLLLIKQKEDNAIILITFLKI